MSAKALQVLLALGLVLTACSSAAAPTATSTSTPKPTATATPPPTATPTPLPPKVTLNAQTACLAGPGIVYDTVATLEVGDKAEVTGKDADGVYWIVKNPNGDGECWVEGQFVSIDGETDSLASIAPPPTPTLAPPSAPKNFAGTVGCTVLYSPRINKFTGIEVIITLKWEHDSRNTDGYNVYKYDKLIGTTDSNTLEFKDLFTLTLPMNTTLPIIRYAIEAFNSVGSSSRVEFVFNQQCGTFQYDW